MEIKIKTQNSTTFWNVNLRPKVSESVIHNNAYWINVSGKNSEPSLSSTDWVFVSEVVNPGSLKIASKGVGNVSLDIEPGDIVFGMLNDNVTFIPFGKYLGPIESGGTQNILNYITNPLEF